MLRALLTEKNSSLIMTVDRLNGEPPQISFVIPIFNQEEIIAKHLGAIVENSALAFEMILIDDASTDKTRIVIEEFMNNTELISSDKKFIIKYFRNRFSWFETRCDDFGIRKCTAQIVIEIQADMLIKENGFDRRIKEIMNSDENLFAISGRAGHQIADLPAIRGSKSSEDISDRILTFKLAKRIKFKFIKIVKRKNREEINPHFQSNLTWAADQTFNTDIVFPNQDSNFKSAGWMNELIELLPYVGDNAATLALKQHFNLVWKCETVNRGPLALKKDIYLKLGGFNTFAFYQGNDDHDLCIRAGQMGYSVGFSPINFASPLSLGNARRKRKLRQKFWSKFNRKLRSKRLGESALVLTQSAKVTTP